MTTVFKNRDELEANVIRRARAVMSIRNVKNPQNVKVCVNALRRLSGLEFTDQQLADTARDVAEDTIFHGIEYFR